LIIDFIYFLSIDSVTGIIVEKVDYFPAKEGKCAFLKFNLADKTGVFQVVLFKGHADQYGVVSEEEKLKVGDVIKLFDVRAGVNTFDQGWQLKPSTNEATPLVIEILMDEDATELKTSEVSNVPFSRPRTTPRRQLSYGSPAGPSSSQPSPAKRGRTINEPAPKLKTYKETKIDSIKCLLRDLSIEDQFALINKFEKTVVDEQQKKGQTLNNEAIAEICASKLNIICLITASWEDKEEKITLNKFENELLEK
jgi:hypothetical protein